MDKVIFPKHRGCYLPLLLFFVIIFLMMPRARKFNYDYRKGSTWMYDNLVAQFDFPILKTDAEYLADKENCYSSVSPYYRLNSTVYPQISRTLKSLSYESSENVRPVVEKTVADIYGRGVIQQSDDIPASFSGTVNVRTDKTVSLAPYSDFYSVNEARNEIASALSAAFPEMNVDSLLLASGISEILVPNILFDSQMTERLLQEALADVSVTSGMVYSGTELVAKGEDITSEKEQILNSYKTEYESKFGYQGKEIHQWVANALFTIVLLGMVFLILCYFGRVYFDNIEANMNLYLYLLTVFTITCLAIFVVQRYNYEWLFAVPFPLATIYMLAFFKKRIVMPIYTVALLPLLVFAHNGAELYIMNLFAGMVCIVTFGYFNRGWLQFVNALCIFVSMILVYVVFELMHGMSDTHTIYHFIEILLASMFCVAGYPLIYLFEILFGLVSSTRLNELSDTNANKLLQELSRKAPGTFQHSLQVMNLADSVGKKLGANLDILRVGALYHDIGKTNNPACFTENDITIASEYHSGLSLQESAADIIRHVSDGLALAEEHRLPAVVKDFIRTHHGTTFAGYFYTKYLNDGGDPANADDFRYKGIPPQTKEQVILMICDSVEAAARSLKDYSEESISSLVDRITDSKMEAGQFTEAAVTMREISMIKTELKQCLARIYHARIAYPNAKKAR